jgi:F-type H+-transporting ATPase subunit gamma
MIQNLHHLRRKIKTAKSIAQVTRAIGMIAASKIKKAQEAVLRYRPYAEGVAAQTRLVIKGIDRETFNHPYLEPRGPGGKLIVVISPDKGLCGSLVTNLFRRFLQLDYRNAAIVAVGEKMEGFCARMNCNLVASFPLKSKLPHYSIVYPILEIIDGHYLSGRVKKVELLYTRYTSLLSHTPTVQSLLPMEPAEYGEAGLKGGRFSGGGTEAGERTILTVEPGEAEVLSDLLQSCIVVSLYNAIIEAYTSEQAARTIAMQTAKQNALDIADYLTLTYNKASQERTTRELLDLANVHGGIGERK